MSVGLSRLIVMFGAAPDNGRPSHCDAIAFDTVQLAASGSPGPLWNVLLTSTSIFGIVEEPAAGNLVVTPGEKLQNGFTGLYCGTSLAVENPPVCSGRSSRMSQ